MLKMNIEVTIQDNIDIIRIKRPEKKNAISPNVTFCLS